MKGKTQWVVIREMNEVGELRVSPKDSINFTLQISICLPMWQIEG